VTVGAPSCSDALKQLATGDLARFAGLPAGCRRADAEAAFGDSGPLPDDPGGTLGPFRTHPATPPAPLGVMVFYDDPSDVDAITCVRIDQPTFPYTEAIGTPEEIAPSGLGAVPQQYVYAARGLTLHVDETRREIVRLYAYRPMSVQEFLASHMARAHIHRHGHR
jgi:hypothetical protein